MAGKDDFVSAMDQGNMASPGYRKQLEREQGLEGVHPEMWGLGSLARAAAAKIGSAAKGLRNVASPERDLAGTVTGSPRMDEALYAMRGPAADTAGIDRALGEAQTRVAARQLTPAQKADWIKTGEAPSNWGEMRRNASYIGADVGRVTAAPPAPLPTSRELTDKAVAKISDLSQNARRGYDLPLSVASTVDSVRQANQGGANLRRYEGPQAVPTQVEPLSRSLRYRYGE